MSLVMFCLLFSFVDYVPVKGEIIWYLSLTVWSVGSWGGTVRRGDYRNYYKGHMDKIKGEGGGGEGGEFGWDRVQGWGENADKCN